MSNLSKPIYGARFVKSLAKNAVSGNFERILTETDLTAISAAITNINVLNATTTAEQAAAIAAIQTAQTVLTNNDSTTNAQVQALQTLTSQLQVLVGNAEESAEIDGLSGAITVINSALAGIATINANQQEEIEANADAIDVLEAENTVQGAAIQANADAITLVEAANTAQGAAIQANADAIALVEAANTAQGTAIQANADAIALVEAANIAQETAIQANADAIALVEVANTAQETAIQANADAIADLEEASLHTVMVFGNGFQPLPDNTTSEDIVHLIEFATDIHVCSVVEVGATEAVSLGVPFSYVVENGVINTKKVKVLIPANTTNWQLKFLTTGVWNPAA